MKLPISDIAFTPAVKAAQERLGSRRAYAKMEERGKQGPWYDTITSDLAEFVAERDSLYLGTASADGQPYIQHRGGRKGFLKVLDEHRLALVDYAGNSQYISLGNLSENNKAFLFLMDYPNRQRIKIWGTAEFVEDDRELLARVTDADYDAIIIGTGHSGPSLAGRLAGAGLQVAVVERNLFGGTCVNTGCIPTKTLVANTRYTGIQRAMHVHPTVSELIPTVLGDLQPIE